MDLELLLELLLFGLWEPGKLLDYFPLFLDFDFDLELDFLFLILLDLDRDFEAELAFFLFELIFIYDFPNFVIF